MIFKLLMDKLVNYCLVGKTKQNMAEVTNIDDEKPGIFLIQSNEDIQIFIYLFFFYLHQ